MADLITLTPQPIRILQSSTFPLLQPIYLALDVGGYDFLDMEAGVVANEGTTQVTTFQLDLYTGMQAHTDDGWVSVTTGQSLITLTAPNSWVRTTWSTGLLRYIRWRVTSMSGGSGGTPAITFFIRGMGRRYAG